MHLLIGLGNPGAEYAGTRHNIGFEVIDWLAQHHHFPSLRVAKNAETSKGKIAGNDVLLVKPLTFMNLSGDAVGALARYYKCEPEQLIVIHDELDFDVGVVRVKKGGGAGGHNGLRSIAAHVGNEFVRIRIGIGKPPNASSGANYVLSRFDGASRSVMTQATETAAAAIEMILQKGVAPAMNHFNQR